MATARVIHFGNDAYQRVQTLQKVGYVVRVSDSLSQLRLDLERDESVGAVTVAEGSRRTTERAAAIVRQYSGAPLILFRCSNGPLSVKRFDRVYQSSAPAPSWLFDMAVLVEQSLRLQTDARRLMAKAERLHAEVEDLFRESQRQLARSVAERKRDQGPVKPWHERTDQND
jgi:hypothetical protein